MNRPIAISVFLLALSLIAPSSAQALEDFNPAWAELYTRGMWATVLPSGAVGFEVGLGTSRESLETKDIQADNYGRSLVRLGVGSRTELQVGFDGWDSQEVTFNDVGRRLLSAIHAVHPRAGVPLVPSQKFANPHTGSP